MLIPLASEAAVPRISRTMLAMVCFHFSVGPAGSLVARVSAGLPFRNVFARMEGVDARLGAERKNLTAAPALHRLSDRAVRLHQIHRRHARNPVIVAYRKAALLRIQKGGKSDAIFAVELDRIRVIVLRNTINRELSGGVNPFQ